MTQPLNPIRGAVFVVASEFMFASAGAGVRAVSADLPTEMVVFFRNAFGLLLLLPWVLYAGREVWATRNLRFHVLRAAWGLAAMYCYFYAIAHIHLAEAVLLKLTSPFFIPFMATLWLGESVSRKIKWAIVVGFAGVALILRPGSGTFTLVALVGLTSGVFDALSKVTVRRASRTESPLRIVLFFAMFATVVSAIPLVWTWRTPSLQSLGWMVAVGAVATTGQLLLSRGYALAQAAQVGPLAYVSVVIAAIYGWVFWGEAVRPATVVGAVLIFAAGVLVMRRGRVPEPVAPD